MASLPILSLTGALSSSPKFGRPSVGPSVPQPASTWGSSHRPMVRWSVLTKIWRPPYVVSLLTIPLLGAAICLGLRIDIAPSQVRPLACHLLRLPWDTSYRWMRLLCPWARPTCTNTGESGGTYWCGASPLLQLQPVPGWLSQGPCPKVPAESEGLALHSGHPSQDPVQEALPQFIDPYETESSLKPSTVHLKLPRSLQIHLTFHISQLKPVSSSKLCMPAKQPLPAQVIGNHPAYTVCHLLNIHHHS